MFISTFFYRKRKIVQIFLLAFSSLLFLQCNNDSFNDFSWGTDEVSHKNISVDDPLSQKVFLALEARKDQVNKAIAQGLDFRYLDITDIRHSILNGKDFVYIPFTGSYNDYQMTLVAYVPNDGAPVQMLLRESNLLNEEGAQKDTHLEIYSLDFSVSLKGVGKTSKTIGLTARMDGEKNDCGDFSNGDCAENLGGELEGATVTAPYRPPYSPPVMMPSWPSNGYGSGSSSDNGGYPFNGPGYGGSGGAPSRRPTVVPPSCKSFDFKNTSSNWQEATVVNIRFNVMVIEIINGIKVRKTHLIIFPEPVKFGMPRKFANGTSIPSGLAAEIGARAINHAIDDVISKYYNLVVNSTSVISSDFQSNLKNEFREFSNGGRVNFNDRSYVNKATSYKTYGVIPDDCY